MPLNALEAAITAGVPHEVKALGGGQCVCALQWTGPACATLALLPASRTAGFHSPHNTHQADVNTSSWGGSILRDEATGIWHMYSAEMIQHCGIGAWEPDR